MAKKREKPVENPINRNLIASLAQPPRPLEIVEDDAPRKAVEASASAVPGAPPAVGKRRKSKENHRIKVREGGERKVAVQRTRFNPNEIEENASFTRFMSELVGSKVSESDITRALWSLARQSKDELRAIRSKAPRLARPAYADRLGSAAYEDAIAVFLHRALKLASIEF